MFEVANALLALARRKRIKSDEFAAARTFLMDLSPKVDDADYHLVFGKITELAQQYSLSVYDAAYLELSVRRGLPLASRDAALNKAAKLCGAETLL